VNKYDATELAYKNGYEKGYEEAVQKVAAHLRGKCASDACSSVIHLHKCELEQLVREWMEGSRQNGTESKEE